MMKDCFLKKPQGVIPNMFKASGLKTLLCYSETCQETITEHLSGIYVQLNSKGTLKKVLKLTG